VLTTLSKDVCNFAQRELPAPDKLSHWARRRTAWLAYPRVATLFQMPAISVPQRRIQLAPVSQTKLDAALTKDRHQTTAMH